MNIQKTLVKLDNFQRRHSLPGLIFAVIKKYGDDQAGYQAALLTYYGFLSLFPLLLVAVTGLQIVAPTYTWLQADILKAVTGNFPILGSQLTDHITSLHRSGLALAVGLVFLLYGARGVATAFRSGVNHIWGVARSEQLGFPHSTANDLVIIIVGGLGLVSTAAITGTVAALGHGILPRALSYLAGVTLLYVLFNYLFSSVLPNRIAAKQTRLSAITTAVGLVVMQILGGLILARVLKNLDALYSYFALSLGLLFWIYLQAQVVYYAVEIAVVRSLKLWPRSLSGKNLTEYDRQVIKHQESSFTA